MRAVLAIILLPAAAWLGADLLVPGPKAKPPLDDPVGKSRLVEVEPGVRLEVVDFGGTGRAVVLLAGLGGAAHIFDRFAAGLTPRYHVYAISRRGYGASSVPESGYGARRLGEDVVAVCDALGLHRPVLIGHSVAGEELSAVAALHPEKVSGLVYLEAGYGYALYDPAHPDWVARMRLISRLETWLAPPPLRRPPREIIAGMERFTRIPAPVLAIFADPHQGMSAAKDRQVEWQAQAFERQVPGARVVRIPHADHMIFESNPLQVRREISSFIASLQP